MAFTDKWTRVQLRTNVRTELLDAAGRWWSDDEINCAIEEWQSELQNELEFVWGTATTTLTATQGTATLTSFATDVARIDAVYIDGTRIPARDKSELSLIDPTWRITPPSAPRVVYQDSPFTFSVWPRTDIARPVIVEYPRSLVFIADTSTMQIPPWTRYSCKNFVAWHLGYSRMGENINLQKAARYRARFDRQKLGFRTICENFFPDKYRMLKPGVRYEGDILNPNRNFVSLHEPFS